MWCIGIWVGMNEKHLHRLRKHSRLQAHLAFSPREVKSTTKEPCWPSLATGVSQTGIWVSGGLWQSNPIGRLLPDFGHDSEVKSGQQHGALASRGDLHKIGPGESRSRSTRPTLLCATAGGRNPHWTSSVQGDLKSMVEWPIRCSEMAHAFENTIWQGNRVIPAYFVVDAARGNFRLSGCRCIGSAWTERWRPSTFKSGIHGEGQCSRSTMYRQGGTSYKHVLLLTCLHLPRSSDQRPLLLVGWEPLLCV